LHCRFSIANRYRASKRKNRPKITLGAVFKLLNFQPTREKNSRN
jgi:hypothetical protein